VLLSDCTFGQIDFINCLPITRILQRDKPERLGLVMGTPGALNQKYRQGTLDLGAMSSHYFLEDGNFELFPDISISAQGPVGSVLYFGRKKLSQLSGLNRRLKISVPQASASSVRLLHILLCECYGLEADFIPVQNPEADIESDGFLLFGDLALTTDRDLAASGAINGLERLDMAQWWFENYRLPMVFGVWAARKSWIAEHGEDFANISTFLAASWGKGLTQDLPAVIAEAAERTDLSFERLQQYYLKELDFSFGARHAEGLELYRKLCKKHDLL